MKITIIFALLVLNMSSFILAQDNAKQIADGFINDLKVENFDKAYKNFDSSITVQFSLQQLKDVWAQIKGQYGDITKIGEPQISKMTTSTLLVYPIDYQKGGLNAQIAVNLFGQISGFFLSMRPESFAYIFPPYTDTTKYEEVNIKFGDPNFELGATITIPKNVQDMPVVILVHGSGPHDRDESIGPNKPFKDLAGGLASNGIAVFRYEKRTKEHGARLNPNKLDLNVETVEDVIYAIKYIENNGKKIRIDLNKVFVLGHSLGGSLLPRINKQTNNIKGFISMAGMTRSIDQVLMEQTYYIYNLDSVYDDAEKQDFETLKEQLLRVLSKDLNVNTPADSLPLNLPARYWLDFRTLYARKEAESISKPILVLQGESDYQVTLEDFEGWKEALKNNQSAKFISYPSLNHLFMKSPNAKSKPQEYYEPGHIETKVINDIVNWIKTN